MRIILPLMWAVVTSAISMSPPDIDSVNVVCNGFATAKSIASRTASIKEKTSPDPTIEALRIDFINSLSEIGGKFRFGIQKGEVYSRSGHKVARDFIYALEQFTAGDLQAEDVSDVAGPIIKRVTELLSNANEMHRIFGVVQTDLEKLEMKAEGNRRTLDGHITETQLLIDRERGRRSDSAAIGVLGVIAGIFFPPIAPVVIGYGIAENSRHHDNVVEGLHALKHQRSFYDDLQSLLEVIMQAKSGTAIQILYWSQTLDQLESLKDYSVDWLENVSSPWMTKKLVAQWKVVEQKYSECAYMVSNHLYSDETRAQL